MRGRVGVRQRRGREDDVGKTQEMNDHEETESLLPRHGRDAGEAVNGTAYHRKGSNYYNLGDNPAAEGLRQRLHEQSLESTAIDRCLCCPPWCFITVNGVHLHPLSISLVLLWTVGIIVLLFVISDDVQKKWPRLMGKLSPGTSVSLHRAHSLDFPAITVCNLAKSVPLTPVKCSTYDSTGECPEFHVPFLKRFEKGTASGNGSPEDDEWVYESSLDMRKNISEIVRHKLTRENRLRHCLVFNNDLSSDPYQTHRKGLADALTLVLSINLNKYPKGAKYSGVHIDLHSQCDRALGDCPDELESTIVAAPGSPRFYRMTKHRHMYLNGTSVEYYDAKDSASGDYEFSKHFGPEDDTVVLTFLYDDMSLMEVREVPQYTWFNMLAEIGGIGGLLFGVGIFQLISSLLKCVFLGKSHINSLFV